MKLHELIFCAASAGMCAAMLWCMSNLDETFYICVCAFMAAFWGSLAAFVVWARICEREKRLANEPTIIWPHGRRPQ